MSDQAPPRKRVDEVPDYSDVFARPNTDKLENRDPSLFYQWVPQDKVADYLRPSPILDGTQICGWAVVHNDEDGCGPRPLKGFPDDAIRSSSVVKRRSDVLMCIPKSEINRKLRAEHEERLSFEREHSAGRSGTSDGSVTVVDATGAAADAMIKQQGGP